MSTTNLISHRLFVSALAQEPRPDVLEEVAADYIRDSQPATAVQVEVLRGKDPLNTWSEDDLASHQHTRSW